MFFFSKTGEYKSVSQNQGVGPNLTKMYPNSGAHIDPQKFFWLYFYHLVVKQVM